jgi:hypothetical protein
MKPLFLVAAILFSIAGSASAQDLHGSITGKVVDPQQAVIPAVTVVVTHAETGAVSRTQTNRDGYFEVNLLNPGHYSVTLEAAGFKKLTRTGSSWTSAGDWKLHSSSMSQVNESVQVTGGAPLLDTTTADSGRTIDRRQIVELPFADANPHYRWRARHGDGPAGWLRAILRCGGGIQAANHHL